MSIDLVPILPLWLIVAVTIGLLILLAYGSAILLRKRVPARWIGILGILRCVIIVVFLLCLLQPVFSMAKQVMRRPGLLVMVDTSQSMHDSTDYDALMKSLRGDLAQHLQDEYDVRWFAFDSDAPDGCRANQ